MVDLQSSRNSFDGFEKPFKTLFLVGKNRGLSSLLFSSGMNLIVFNPVLTECRSLYRGGME